MNNTCATEKTAKKYGKLIFLAAAFLFAGMLSGCAPTAVQEDRGDLFWPAPPDKPRIKYLESWSSQDDFGRGGFDVFMDSVIGREDVFRLRKPMSAAADSGGRIHVTDTAMGAVVVFDRAAKKVGMYGSGELGKLNVPVCITIYEEGDRVFVSDSKADIVNAYRLNGSFVMVIGGQVEKTFENPVGLAVDKKLKRLYIVDTKKHKVFVYSVDGTFLSSFGERGTEDGQMNYPTYAAVDSKGELYVVDSGNFRIQVFSPEGKFLRKWGQVGDSMGSFARPKGVAIDSEDHIYVVDTAFNNVQIFNREGRLLMFFGHLGFGRGEFQTPGDISIDSHDRIYVADQLNKRVQVFQFLGGRYTGPDRVPSEEEKPPEKQQMPAPVGK